MRTIQRPGGSLMTLVATATLAVIWSLLVASAAQSADPAPAGSAASTAPTAPAERTPESAPPATVFHSDANGYGLSLPDGWVEIPAEKLAKLHQALSNKARRSSTFEAGFQPVDKDWFKSAYVVIHVIPYDGGLEPDLGRMLKRVADVERSFGQNLTEDVQRKISSSKLQGITFEPATRVYTLLAEEAVPGFGTTRIMSYGHFGRRVLVSVNCYARGDAALAKYRPELDAVAESFKFDPAQAYDPQAAASPTVALLHENLGRLGAAGAMVAVVLGVVMLRRRRRG